MQRMSHSRDQWHLTAHRLDSLNYVTTHSNGQEALQSRTRSSTLVSIRNKVFSKKNSEEDSNDSFWTKPRPSFFVQSFHPSKKKFKKESPNTNKYIFSRDFLESGRFFVKKNTRKQNRKKKKREKHNKRKKNKRTTEKWKRVRSEKKR